MLCGQLGATVCAPCAGGLSPAPSLAVPHGIDDCLALFDYDSARPLVTAMKNAGRRDLVGWLAERLTASAVPAAGTVITWAPTGRARQLARGYDQAELLARALARRWQVSALALLRRAPGPAQAGRTAEERRTNPVFTVTGRVPVAVVLVDDVVTTGATLTAAARALRRAGACSVTAVAVARARRSRSG